MIIPIVIAVIVIAGIVLLGAAFGMGRQMLVMLIVVLVALGVIGYKKYQGFQQFAAIKSGMMHATQTVSTAKATTEDWQSKMEAVGSIRAVRGVDVSNELAGIVEDIRFHSGDDVKAGSVLLSLRAEDDIAKLHALQATSRLAAITLTRDKKQLKAQAVSQATVDNDQANLANALAQVAQQQATVDKKVIRAPFGGHLGIRNIDLGQYLTPGTAIVTLQALDPVYLDFNLPQQAIAHIHVGQKLDAKNDTWPDRKFAGSIAAINPKVDLSTRNVQIRAELANHDHALLPGMYATADITVGEPGHFVTLPQTAITYNPYGDTVYLVKKARGDDDKDQLTVAQTFVTVGTTRGDQVQILKGIREGDEVVTSGQLKLQNGATITVNNEVQPKNDAAPTPQEQ